MSVKGTAISPTSSSTSKSTRPASPRKEQSASTWCGCCCCCGKDDDEDDREIVVHMNDKDANAPYDYPDNFIRTSKYTIFTFIPLGLLYQFRKISNCYFLVNMIICFIPGVSPVNPLTAAMPLAFVLGVSLIKEGFEDYKRHKADSKANSLPVQVIRDGKLVTVKSHKLTAGDVIRIDEDDEVRADVILLSSTSQEGQTFIDTCNLDGETSLKKRRALEVTGFLNSVEQFMNTKIVVHTSAPEPGLLSWNGMMILNDREEYALSLDQFLYRGCCLKNTDSVWGMVVYSGVDTKLFKNLKERPPKSSSLDRKLNIVILFLAAVMLSIIIILCALACWWNSTHYSYWYIHWYLVENNPVKVFFFRFLSYFVLLSYFIPISLFVTIELCKLIQSKWMNADNEMMKFVRGRWTGCHANTSNLNEQLSLLRFIFTDKTGTLTENIMEFKEGDVLGQPFSLSDKETIAALLKPDHPSYNAAVHYFTTLAVCNQVDPFEKDGSIVYEGSSPDEVALVKAAAECGMKLMKRTTKVITLELPDGTTKNYQIRAVLEFTPERKMMSIVLEETESGRLFVFNKGADSFVALQLDQGSETQQHMMKASERLSEMSHTGLRTLLLTSKEISREEFDAWYYRFLEAGKILSGREAAVDAVCLELEKNLRLVGCTAIEDRLQDQVPETLSFFLSAGVIVWMLTGDKRETAVTIAATSSICDPRSDYIDHVDIGSLKPDDPAAIEKVGKDLEVIQQHLEAGDDKKCTLVIDGPALSIAMEHYFDVFLDVSQRLRSAVCCRLTPLQKANVVHMFQKHTGETALAIGDGANDVSMIQEGRIGIGIQGLEGSQAALSADYSIPSFKDLRRLCAVHGRYSLYRNSSCVMVSLYKNFTLALIQVIFPAYCGFSAQTYFDAWLLTFYNVIMTSIPPFFMGIFEKDIPEEALLERPLLFAECSRGLYFNAREVLKWSAESVIHAILIFYVCYTVLIDRDHQKESNLSGAMTTTTAFCCLVVTVLTRFTLQIRYWQWIEIAGIVLSYIIALLVLLVYSAIPFLFGTNSFYKQFFILCSDPKFWFLLMLFSFFVMVSDYIILFFQASFFPTIRDRARRQHFFRNVHLNAPM